MSMAFMVICTYRYTNGKTEQRTYNEEGLEQALVRRSKEVTKQHTISIEITQRVSLWRRNGS